MHKFSQRYLNLLPAYSTSAAGEEMLLQENAFSVLLPTSDGVHGLHYL